jgi:hypothetical protein
MTSHTTSTSTGGGSNPSAWPAHTLDRFGAADEIDISTRRDDDNLRGFVPIWIVTVDNALYVRSHRGHDGAWYRHATARPAARSGRPASRPTSPSPRSKRTSVTCSRRSATPTGPSTAVTATATCSRCSPNKPSPPPCDSSREPDAVATPPTRRERNPS